MEKHLPSLGKKKRKNLQEQFIEGREYYTNEEFEKMIKKELKRKLP
jgi:hypothetical protein